MLTGTSNRVARKAEISAPAPMGLLARAKGCLDGGRYEESLDLTRLILVTDPGHLGALETRVRAQWRLGDLGGALRTLKRLADLNPYEPAYHLMRAHAHQLSGRLREARAAYERCVEMDDPATLTEALEGVAETCGALGESPTPLPVRGVTEFMPEASETTIWVDSAYAREERTLIAAVRPS